MPELPEVEVVRRGLADHVLDRIIAEVTVAHPRAVRRHVAGGEDFAARLKGRTISAARRRGKYLWLELDSAGPGDDAILAHLGMSGQMLVATPDRPDEKHLRIRLRFDDAGPELRFVDQRTFGGLSVHPLTEGAGGGLLPEPVAHIGRDPMDPLFSLDAAVAGMRRPAPRSSGRCSTRRWCPGSGTSTPTRRSGARGCTVRDRPRSSPGSRASPSSRPPPR